MVSAIALMASAWAGVAFGPAAVPTITGVPSRSTIHQRSRLLGISTWAVPGVASKNANEPPLHFA